MLIVLTWRVEAQQVIDVGWSPYTYLYITCSFLNSCAFLWLALIFEDDS